MKSPGRKAPSVAVLIPVYQSDRWIRQTLETVSSQTIQPDQIVIVDDGSTDNSVTICHEFAARSDIPMRIITQENGGQSRARNRALLEVESDYVALLDSDDLWHPEKLQRQLPLLETSGIDAVTCGYFLYREDAPIPATGIFFDWSKTALEGWLRGYGAGPGLASTMVIRTSVLKSLGGFREDLSVFADLEFALRLQSTSGIACEPSALVAYRQHTDQIHRKADVLLNDAKSFIEVAGIGEDGQILMDNMRFLSAVRTIRARDYAGGMKQLRSCGSRGGHFIVFAWQRFNRRRSSALPMQIKWSAWLGENIR